MEEYPDYDEVSRLRIQLHEERCKVEHLAKQNAMLESLNARIIKASIQDHGDWRSKCNNLETELRAEINRLAAENERLSRMFAELETPYLSNNLIDSAYAEKLKALAAENERLRKLLEMYLKADPLIGEAVASAMLAQKEGKSV